MMDNRPPDMAEKDDFIIDATWNPRNKYLADIKLFNDLMQVAETWDNPPAACRSLSFRTLTSVNLRLAAVHYLVCKTAETAQREVIV